MKQLNFFDKVLLFTNSIAAALLIISYIIPYINPSQYPSVAVFSLAYPAILILNLIFIILWILKLKRQFLLSTIVVIIGIKHVNAFFSFTKKENSNKNDITLISYNVRHFNIGNWIKTPNIQQKINNFITKQEADIICFQEYRNGKNISFNLPYKKIVKTLNSGLAIFTKYPIINSGSLFFEKSSNSVLYVDLKKNNDTIRIYNIHLQSFSINPNKVHSGMSTNKALLHRFKRVFKQQASQVLIIKEHIKKCPYPSILAGDFNNTAFSWNYKQLIEGRKDAFIEAGNGLGKTYDNKIPFRIDFILPDDKMTVNSFTTFKDKFSDHFPIMAKISLNN